MVVVVTEEQAVRRNSYNPVGRVFVVVTGIPCNFSESLHILLERVPNHDDGSWMPLTFRLVFLRFFNYPISFTWRCSTLIYFFLNGFFHPSIVSSFRSVDEFNFNFNRMFKIISKFIMLKYFILASPLFVEWKFPWETLSRKLIILLLWFWSRIS